MVGITVWPEAAKRVVLKFTAYQARYIRTLPLHHSQAEVTTKGDEVTFSYLLIPNYELEQKIMMYGEEVEVLEPKPLRDRIKTRLKKAAGLYE